MQRPPAGLRNFEEPAQQAAEQAVQGMKLAGTWGKYQKKLEDVLDIRYFLFGLVHDMAAAGRKERAWDSLRMLESYRLLKEDVHCPEEALEFWDDYEESYIRKRFAGADKELPRIKCVRLILTTMDRFEKDEFQRNKRFRGYFQQISRFVSIVGPVLYIAARLTILVLMFTSLRAVPAGVYENTPWSKFLPSLS
jgi:hypothetical protein